MWEYLPGLCCQLAIGDTTKLHQFHPAPCLVSFVTYRTEHKPKWGTVFESTSYDVNR